MLTVAAEMNADDVQVRQEQILTELTSCTAVQDSGVAAIIRNIHLRIRWERDKILTVARANVCIIQLPENNVPPSAQTPSVLRR